MFQRSIHLFASIATAVCLVGLVNGCSDPSGAATSLPPKGTSCINAGDGLICTNWTCVHKTGDVVFCTSTQPKGVPLPLGKYPCPSSNGGFYCPAVDVGGGAPDCTATPDLLACQMQPTNPSTGTAGAGGTSGEGSGGVAGSETGTGGAGVGGGGGGNNPGDEGVGTGGVGGDGTGGVGQGSGSGGSSAGSGTGGSNGGSGTGGSDEGGGTGGSIEGGGTGGSIEGGGTGGSIEGSGTGGSIEGGGTGGSAGGPDPGHGAGGCGGSAGTGSGGSGGSSLGCTRTHGYCKNHPDAWPVASLIVGQVTYSKEELVNILMTASECDASLILGHQLVAALLNQAAGAAVPAQIANALSAAQYWMETHKDTDGRLPYGVSPATPDGSAAVALSSILEEFNDGLAGTPHCR
ncbi:MAG TPA: hypothetical protein VFH73_28570 [Polyangia bacterium]|nr:hypothetical protein [Polyangia bacterium]